MLGVYKCQVDLVGSYESKLLLSARLITEKP